ncbi:MAG TPA: chromosomal replication initiator protein DnaA [Pirellulales bacterium]|nr:chromosomal replication initiator protein DnaA [Pirellulales bacterium]
MTKDDTEIVSAVLSALADKVGKDRYEMWFGDNVRVTLAADTLRVAVPNQFFQDWLRTNFRRPIEESCQQALGRDLTVSFLIERDLVRPRPATPGAAPSVAPQPLKIANCDANSASCQSPPAPPSLGQRRFANFESFVVGAGNRLAATSAQEVASQLGRVSPLVLCGPTGVGKTHLVEGIWTAAKRRHPRLHAVYLSAEQFTSYFLEALHTSGVPNFRNKYRGVDLLLIDDLQFFAGKKATLGELLHTIDALSREGRQLVFTADRSPAALAGLGPELVTRLSAGLVCRIDPPDYATRLGIVRGEAARMDMRLPEDVLAFVAKSFRDHARELHGALLKLHATSRALGREVTLALAEQALADSVTTARQPVRLADVRQAICEVFGIDPENLCSSRRTSAVAHPRMLAMWLARKHTRAALAEIGEFFGQRSHTTVLSANKKIGQWMNDPQSVTLADHTLTLAEAVRKVEERLRVG